MDDTIVWPPMGDGLCRWENQRILSSLLTAFTCVMFAAVTKLGTKQQGTKQQRTGTLCALCVKQLCMIPYEHVINL